MFNILIIGAGNIGARHLQGLINVSLKLNIWVVDSSEDSIRTAKSLWNAAGGKQSNHKIKWSKKISQEIKNLDLVILSTSSRQRTKLVNEIVSIANVNYWIFEKILVQSIEDLDLIKNKTKKSQGLWVNTSRRLMKNYKKFKTIFDNEKGAFKIKKIGGAWGLACNSIHYIDLISWWTGENVISVNTEKLNQKWFKSKRLGYFEVTGELLIKFSKGTELILQSNLDIKEESLKINLNNKNWMIVESNNNINISENKNLNGQLELQSKLTGPMVQKILLDGICELPTFKESSQQHIIYLNAMLKHWNSSNNCNDIKILIT